MSVARAYTQIQNNQPPEVHNFEEHMGLVKRIAYHMKGRLPSSVQVEDLIQAGMIGLLEAIQKYNAAQGASFETYAGIRIRGAILDEIRRGDWTPRSVHRKARELAEAVRVVEARLGREAKDEEVATELGIKLDEYHQILQDAMGAHILSIDMPDQDDLSEDQLTVLDAVDENEPVHELLQAQFHEHLTQAIRSLPEREQLVLSLYYDEELNLKEIGEVLGVSESRVSQILSQALVRIRSRLRDWIDR
jgi:RNA polymerase sigma factor for flagellar operon FliA